LDKANKYKNTNIGSLGQRAAKLPSKFENGFTPGIVEPRPNALAHISPVKAEMADFFLIPPTLKVSNFGAL